MMERYYKPFFFFFSIPCYDISKYDYFTLHSFIRKPPNKKRINDLFISFYDLPYRLYVS